MRQVISDLLQNKLDLSLLVISKVSQRGKRRVLHAYWFFGVGVVERRQRLRQQTGNSVSYRRVTASNFFLTYRHTIGTRRIGGTNAKSEKKSFVWVCCERITFEQHEQRDPATAPAMVRNLKHFLDRRQLFLLLQCAILKRVIECRMWLSKAPKVLRFCFASNNFLVKEGWCWQIAFRRRESVRKSRRSYVFWVLKLRLFLHVLKVCSFVGMCLRTTFRWTIKYETIENVWDLCNWFFPQYYLENQLVCRGWNSVPCFMPFKLYFSQIKAKPILRLFEPIMKGSRL